MPPASLHAIGVRVRFAPILAFFIFALSLTAHGQMQESRIGSLFHLPFGKGKTAKETPPPPLRGEAKLLNWDTKKEFNLNSLNFSTGKTVKSKSFIDNHQVGMKEFQFDQKFAAKTFNSHEYGGAKSAWMGNMKFSTKEANAKGKYQIPNLDAKAAGSKSSPVKEYVDSGKKMSTKQYADQRPYLKHATGAAGGVDHFVDSNPLDPGRQTMGWTGGLDKMTIDDIRTLLNKNK